MRPLLPFALTACVSLAAEGPAVAWRGALWASAATSDRKTPDGSLFLRPLDAGNGRLALDGIQAGTDVDLTGGWAFTFTLLGGRMARSLNEATTPASAGELAWPEAFVTWTRGADTFRFGRMYTPMGLEVVDGNPNITASRGLLFSFALPFTQVGFHWRRAFSPSWSADLWIHDGEDRLRGDGRGRTGGIGVTYNHGGSPDHFASAMAFSSPGQDIGAEGGRRTRVSLCGQWILDRFTVQFEAEAGREDLGPGAPEGDPERAAWSGAGLTLKIPLGGGWSLFGRAEAMDDDTGLRLGADATLGAALTPGRGAELRATSFALGAERRWKQASTRFELRRDALDVQVDDASGRGFQDALSATWTVGFSF